MENQEICPGCKQPYPEAGFNVVCPNCGHVQWGMILGQYVLGAVLIWVLIQVAPDIASPFWRGVVRWSAGIFCVLFLLTGVVGTVQAVLARRHPSEGTVRAPVMEDADLANPQEPEGNHAVAEHLAMWRAGADAWIEWREQYPDIHPNLSGADLAGTSLAGVDLSGVDLQGADLSGADLDMVHFTGTNMDHARLVGADLSFSVHHGTHLRDADLSLADLNHAEMAMTDLSGANLQNANLSEANLTTSFLRGVNLRFANLYGANLIQADCRDANFSGVDLGNTNLQMALYNKRTVWPRGFEPLAAGALME